MQFQQGGATEGPRGQVDGEERLRRMLTEAIGEALGIRKKRSVLVDTVRHGAKFHHVKWLAVQAGTPLDKKYRSTYI